MDSIHSNESYYHPGRGKPDHTRPYFNYRSFDRHPYHPLYQTIPGPRCQPSITLPTVPYVLPAPSPSTEYGCSHIGVTPTDLYPVLPQAIGLPYVDVTVQTLGRNTSGRGLRDEDRKVCGGSTSRKLVPQETYKPPRHQKGLSGIQTVEFSVYGEKGIRLSDVLEGKWAGFDGRDDRPLFGDHRLSIMLRLQLVGCSPWQSKVSTVDYTTKRQPIVRTKLASEVAKGIKKFLERERAIGHGDRSLCNWRDTLLSDVFLTRLVRVSAASWQPEVFVVQSTYSNDTSVTY